mgnify:CR=1 FL=1
MFRHVAGFSVEASYNWANGFMEKSARRARAQSWKPSFILILEGARPPKRAGKGLGMRGRVSVRGSRLNHLSTCAHCNAAILTAQFAVCMALGALQGYPPLRGGGRRFLRLEAGECFPRKYLGKNKPV